MVEIKKLSDDRDKALKKIRVEQEEIQDPIDDYRNLESKYRDRNPVEANRARIALAQLEEESQPRMAELEANQKFVEGTEKRVVDFLEQQRAMLQG